MPMRIRRVLVSASAFVAVGLATVIIRERLEVAQREADAAMIRRISMQFYPDAAVIDCGRPNSD